MSVLMTLLGPRYRMDGGLFLPDGKSVTARLLVQTLGVDAPLDVPLSVRADLPTRPIVSPGDRVLRGERLAEPIGGESVPVHAPTSGHVAGFGQAWTPADGWVPAVRIEPDGADAGMERAWRWESESFIEQLRGLGVMCPSPRAPAHGVICQAVRAGVTDLVVNAMETEPYLTADLRTLVESPGRLIDATCEVADALGVGRVILAMPDRHRRVLRRVESEARGRFVEVAPLPDKYPQCDPVVLTRTLLDREVPPGGSPLDVGVLVAPTAMVRSAADALLDGRPATHAVLSVAGDAVERPGTYRVAVGTTLAALAEKVGLAGRPGQVVWGGPLTGTAILSEQFVVTLDTKAVLFFLRAEEARPAPCIHCGWCVEDCPVGLNPVGLAELEHAPACTPAERLLLRACTGCGLCSYVCPSQIPLAASILRGRAHWDAPGRQGGHSG
jgi:electron transport complex protein RnfC